MSPANDAAGQLQDSFVDEKRAARSGYVVDGGYGPGDGPIYNPSGFAQTAAMRLAAPCYFSGDACSM
jgi:hypothetical protein